MVDGGGALRWDQPVSSGSYKVIIEPTAPRRIPLAADYRHYVRGKWRLPASEDALPRGAPCRPYDQSQVRGLRILNRSLMSCEICAALTFIGNLGTALTDRACGSCHWAPPLITGLISTRAGAATGPPPGR